VQASIGSKEYIEGLNFIAPISGGNASAPASDGGRGVPSPIQPLGKKTLSTTNGSDPASAATQGEPPSLMPEPALPDCETVPLVEPVPPVVEPVLLPDAAPLLAGGELDAHPASPAVRDIAATGAHARQKHRLETGAVTRETKRTMMTSVKGFSSLASGNPRDVTLEGALRQGRKQYGNRGQSLGRPWAPNAPVDDGGSARDELTWPP
jgi:hypothetical protein